MWQKYASLESLLRSYESVAVAFSGGVDSSLLLTAALSVLGDRVLAVTARSPTHPPHELDEAGAIATSLGARHRFVDTVELSEPSFTRNSPERCYICKRSMLQSVVLVALREGFRTVVEGTNRDVKASSPPGLRAVNELGVRSPFLEVGMGMEQIRLIAREKGLPNWSSPSPTCLVSRIPHGTRITEDRLARIYRAELAARALGLRDVRVADHGDVARIEVPAGEMDRLLDPALRGELVASVRATGFECVTLDLDGASR